MINCSCNNVAGCTCEIARRPKQKGGRPRKFPNATDEEYRAMRNLNRHKGPTRRLQ